MNPLDGNHRQRLDRLASLLTLLEALPIAALIVGHDGRITAANGQAERLFGYAPGELDGALVEQLMKESQRAPHVHERDLFVAAARSRPMAAGRDLEGLRKDGTTVPLEIGLGQIEVDEGAFVLAIVHDRSARR